MCLNSFWNYCLQMSQTLFEILDSQVPNKKIKIEGKVLRYDGEKRIIVISDGSIHFYAFLNLSINDEIISEAQPPCWFNNIILEFIPPASLRPDDSLKRHSINIVELSLPMKDRIRGPDEVVLSSPWNLIGPTEINLGLKLLKQCIGECIGK